MKIGILSMQKIHNYGSFLQALSLKKQMEARGHDVYFVDIEPGTQVVRRAERPTRTALLRKIDRHVLKRAEHYLQFKRMAKLHISDQESYLDIKRVLPSEAQFDLVIIGSDEVFHATAPSPWGFTQQLFGKVKNTNRVVTYAASCGQTTYESAEQVGIVNAIRESMCNLDSISVRDQNTKNFVEKISGRTPLCHVDPVFITDFDEYIPVVAKRKPYLLVYAYANRIQDTGEIETIKRYAKEHGLQTVAVGMYQKWCDRNLVATGFELLAYVKNAACVVTDTFHGTVFSIKYNKQFVSLVRDSNKNKLAGLLEQFDLLDRSVENLPDFAETMGKPIDYQKTNLLILQERKNAYAYLDEVLQKGMS